MSIVLADIHYKILYIILFLICLSVLSCSIPSTSTFYKPTNKGKKIKVGVADSRGKIRGPKKILVHDLSDDIVTRVFVVFPVYYPESLVGAMVGTVDKPATSPEHKHKLARHKFLHVAFEVPKGHNIRLANDTFEINAKELPSPILAKVVSIQEIAGGEYKYYFEWWKPINDEKKIDALAEISGHQDKEITYYTLNFEYDYQSIYSLTDFPKRLKITYPDMYIDGELISPGLFEFKLKTYTN